jgi:hypothetical protein
MKIRRLRTAAAMSAWILALSFLGCQTAQQQAPADVNAADEHANARDEEARGIAEASLGKDAEVLAHGNLALNGLEQVLAINRFSTKAAVGAGGVNSSQILVTRAAVLEKSDGKWSQVLLCDEHLKNPYGYLRGTLAARVNGWQLEYGQDAKRGLEMKFMPMGKIDAVHVNTDQSSEQKSQTFDVRWNPNAKRYQSFDDSHERYLSEIPTLETPQSILK